jgi:DNA invertase Pin-like site-specific DNA recombinase
MLARLMTRVIVAKLKTTVAVDRESSDTAKITADHLRRCALVYIRQSSAAQVENNRESTERQYKLVERAVELGWKRETIDIIDEDLGVSGSGLADRSGFASMATRVALGQIGIVLGIEVSRLARNNADWYRLLDLCGVTNTLIGDADGIYHPGLFNDRLLLGLKGTMSEAELQIPPKDMCQCSRPRTSSVSRDRQCCSV